MDVSMENPAFTLPPEMILGLLGELSGSKNPHVKQFYELLAKHPASRSSRASSQAPSSLNLSSSLDVSGPGLDLVSAPISGSGLASSDNRCCRNGTKKGTFGPVRYQRKKGMVEEEGVVMEDKEASLESQRVSAEAEAEAEVEVEAEAEGGAGEVEKDGGMSEEDEDGSGGNVEEVSGGKRKRASRKGKKPKKKAKGDTPPKWLTDGSPPDLHTGTDTMVVELSRIISNAGLQSLADLTQVLIHPESIRSTDEPLLSLGALITACAQEEARQTLADFRHMILLIRLAFHLQRELTQTCDDGQKPPTYASIASTFGVSEKSLWNWYNQGSRLIHLASGGTFYILLIIAVLGLKSSLSNRDVTINLSIDSLAFVLRNPEFSGLSKPLVALMETTVISQIMRLRNFEPLRSALRFDIFPPLSDTSPGVVLDFFDIQGMDTLCNGFQNNLFILPSRSALWSPVLADPGPNSIFTSVNGLFQSSSILPILRDAVSIITPLILAKNQSPKIMPKKRKGWTKIERIKADKGILASSAEHLMQLLEEAQEDGIRKEDSYIKVPHSVLEDKTIKFEDADSTFIALAFNEASDIIKDRLGIMQKVLRHLDPQSFEPCQSNKHGYTFNSIHLDTYNRFAEKGDGAPPDVHPHFLYREGNGRSNHNQRATYLSKAIKDNSDQFRLITDALEDICKIVCDVLRKHLPHAFDRLRVFCEILPLNQHPATYPFPGFVLNIQVCTDGHVDINDDTICVVIPFGQFNGGEIVLHEVGLVLELQEGDILIFPSYRITHFNLHFSGVRGSVVMHSDKEVKSWNTNRNGWDDHIVVKS